MNIVDRINKYIDDNKFRVLILDNIIDIINYSEVLDFSSSKISIKCKSTIIEINGTELVISKMLDNEVEVIGKFKSITYV